MSAVELYCFRCADPMRRVRGELTCMPGEMGLSKVVETTLLQRFGERVDMCAAPPARLSAWYCPGCRDPLADDMSCSKCRETLFDLRFQLVELHPHRHER
ncbi:MAG: hypothetical protein KF795_15455 [Labilithrix sp.]|nr:hypothetical protein [Labilithrix sp.]